jgi:antitoxin component YwqK of YwqJK toxin-antitoxin module
MTMIIGPPGSGKTVIAKFRRDRLAAENKNVTLLMFNHVLSTYTGDAKTFFTWLGTWWSDVTGGYRFPKTKVSKGPGKRAKWEWDYEKAMKGVEVTYKPDFQQSGDWGHLILDEAQDFCQEAHALLASAQSIAQGENGSPSLMILADENQRLKAGESSTIQEITDAHFADSDEIYELRQNYRNTKQIALVAAHFFTGLKTGKPIPPDREGETPTIIRSQSVRDAAKRIATYSRNNPSLEVGVLVRSHKTREKILRALEAEDFGASVQTYHYRNAGNAKTHRWDDGGMISVFCFASAKGLEFDAVFLPELQTIQIDAGNRDHTRMELYVMASRARSHLCFMVSADETAAIWELLPDDSKLLSAGSEIEDGTPPKPKPKPTPEKQSPKPKPKPTPEKQRAGESKGTHEIREEKHGNGALKRRATYENGVLHGLCEEYHEIHKTLILKSTYEHGKLHGPFEERWPNGQLKEKGTWVSGDHYHGAYECYNQIGGLQERGIFNMGVECGEWYEYGETVTYEPCDPDLVEALPPLPPKPKKQPPKPKKQPPKPKKQPPKPKKQPPKPKPISPPLPTAQEMDRLLEERTSKTQRPDPKPTPLPEKEPAKRGLFSKLKQIWDILVE